IKEDILNVISNYVDIDEAGLNVEITKEKEVIIPICLLFMRIFL
ncbi:hypothetical protein TheetDRAFT_3311, partial [Thermoanaerobacter ethanolicus JW 200]